jgi:hypothetical protein
MGTLARQHLAWQSYWERPVECVRIIENMVSGNSLLVYQDEPSGLLLRLVLMLIPLASLVGAAVLWSSGETSGSLSLLTSALIIGGVLWVVIPRKYQVYEDHLRIVLGGPLGMNVGFDQIKDIDVTTRTALTMNFVTTIARHYVLIVRKHGFSIAITPKSDQTFVEHANRAMEEWARTRGIQRTPA